MDDLHNILESIDSYLIVIDKELNIVYANSYAKNKFLEGGKAVDSSFISLLQIKDQKFYRCELNKLIHQDNLSHKFDIVIQDNKSKLQNVTLRFQPIKNTDPRLFLIRLSENYELNDSTINNSDYEYRYLKAIFDNTNDAIFMAPISKDGVHGNFVKVNKEACRRLGYTEQELLQLNARTINPEANMEKIRSFGETLKKEGHAIFEAIHEAKDGSRIPVEVNASVIDIDSSQYILSIVKDQRAYKKLQKSESMFGRLMNHSWEELFVFKSENLSLIMANQGALDNLGITQEEVSDYRFTDFMLDTGIEEFKSFTADLFSGDMGKLVFEKTFRRQDGTKYPVEIRLQLSHGEVPPVYFANVQDITERKKTQERLNTLANFDMLTGLPNRALFMDRLSMAMKHSQRSETLVALMFIDLDGFKNINDSYGHDAGDELLIEVSKRLKISVRETDTVARLGGDEFTVILTNLTKIDFVDLVLDKIKSSINRPITLRGKDCLVTPSIGIAIYPLNDIKDSYELIRQADMAMYQAKKAGKNTYKYFSSELFEEEARTITLSNSLRKALDNCELEVYYQPRVSLANDKLLGAEALLRWIKSEHGFVSPEEFIPIMENSGLIHDVGLWVFEQTCKNIVNWKKEIDYIVVSVNVSAKQFEDKSFPNKIKKLVEQYKVAGNIEIEITEGLLLSHSETTVNMLNELKECGITISLDDFGTGYSSLSYLKQIPIDVIKIDRSFVMDMTENNDSMEIVKAIISLSKSLNRSVIAEGIEEQEHVNILKTLNCDEGQGYFFSKPMPMTDFNNFILEYNKPKNKTA